MTDFKVGDNCYIYSQPLTTYQVIGLCRIILELGSYGPFQILEVTKNPYTNSSTVKIQSQNGVVKELSDFWLSKTDNITPVS